MASGRSAACEAGMTTNFVALSLAEVVAEFSATARDTTAVFGRLDDRQLNWRPDVTRWSVAQCFDHLLSADREMFRALDAATDPARPPTLWQRVPVLPGVFG